MMRYENGVPIGCTTYATLGVALLAAAITLGCGGAPAPGSASSNASATQPTGEFQGVPERWIHFEKGVWIPVVDELGEHLELALDAHRSGRDDEAARQLRLAADFLERPGEMPAKNTSEVQSASTVLRHLADELTQGKAVSDAFLRDAFKAAYDAGAPDRWHAVSEQEWFVLVGNPNDHLQRAEELLADSKSQDASDELLKASVLLELESTRAEGQDVEALNRSIALLDDLALRVTSGSEVDPSQWRAIFADVNRTLAEHHLAMARVALEAQNDHRAGRELTAAVSELDHSKGWLTDAQTQGLDPLVQTAKRDTMTVSAAKNPSAGEMQRAMASVRAELGAVGARIPKSSLAAAPAGSAGSTSS